MDYNDIKLRIKRLLKERSITSKQMAADIGYTPQGYRGWFVNHTLRVKTILDIASYLKVDPRLILFGNMDSSLLSAASDERPTYSPLYIEDRIAQLEQRVLELESSIKVKE